jgi:cytochrome c biogenesis protein
MSAISGRRKDTAATGQSYIDRLVSFLGSVRLAIFLLSFIAVASISGTVIKQQASPEEYLSRFSENAYAAIRIIGFDDVFHSWWFLLSLVLFALNLTLCTVNRLTLLLKNRPSEKLPKDSHLNGMALTFLHRGATVDEIGHFLKGWRTVLATGQGAILEKGRFSQYGVIFIHSSVLLVLFGGLVGLSLGFKGSLKLAIGESKDTAVVRGSEAVSWPLGFSVKCVDFKVSFYENGQPREYVSSLQILENNQVVLAKDVRVNDPLTYKGISFYQATYENDTVPEFVIGGKRTPLAEGDAFHEGPLVLTVVRSAESVHDFGPGVQVAYLEDGQPKTVWFLRNVPRLREQTLSGVPVRLDEIRQRQSTGLEVARDPGLWFVWSGFFLLMFGLCINFGFYYRRIYLVPRDGGVLVAGTSRRNKEGFKREFERLKERLDAQR